MTKFWMVTMSTILFGLTTTGCPDGDDGCPVNICDECGNGFCGEAEYADGTCPEDCGSGFCGDGICEEMGAGRETCATCPEDCHTGCGADADADATDDGDTSEVADCPSVVGNWTLTYRNTETGMEGRYVLTLEQDGCLVTGWDDGSLEYTGTISEGGYISLFADGYSDDRTVTGDFTQTPPRMEGDWYDTDLDSGTWWADPQ